MKFLLKTLLLSVFFLFPPPVMAAQLLFVPSTLTLVAGTSQVVSLEVFPEGKQVVGVDVFITFDPQLIEIRSISKTDAFANQLGTEIDKNAGRIKFALTNPFGVTLKTAATIANLEVVAKSTLSTTTLAFDFTPGRSQDTNVVSQGGKDILRSVNSLLITITPAVGITSEILSSTPTPIPSALSTPQPSPTAKLIAGLTHDSGIISPLPDTNITNETPTSPAVLGQNTISPLAQTTLPEPGVDWFIFGFWLLIILVSLVIIIYLNHKLFTIKAQRTEYS